MAVTLTITRHTARNGTKYAVAYLKNQFYFVHVSKEKLKELVKTTTKAGKPCEKYTGKFSVNGNVITI